MLWRSAAIKSVRATILGIWRCTEGVEERFRKRHGPENAAEKRMGTMSVAFAVRIVAQSAALNRRRSPASS
jgi:hypothetical protein